MQSPDSGTCIQKLLASLVLYVAWWRGEESYIYITVYWYIGILWDCGEDRPPAGGGDRENVGHTGRHTSALSELSYNHGSVAAEMNLLSIRGLVNLLSIRL